MADEKWYADLVSKIVTKGDIGAAGIGFGAGIILDAVLHMTGLIPLGMGGAGGAALALGLKNAVQATFGSPPQKKALPEAEQVNLAYRNLHDLLRERNLTQQIYLLERYHDLWRTKLLKNEDFLERMRLLVLDPPDSPPPTRKISPPTF